MNYTDLKSYLKTQRCSLYKETRYGCAVFRNDVSGKKASINLSNENYNQITIVALCKGLRVSCPDHMNHADTALKNILIHDSMMSSDNPPGEA